MHAERNRRRLRDARITDVLQVAEGLYPNHPLQYNYMNLQVQDLPGEDLVAHFPKCFAFIDAAIARGGNVLCHCAGGVSRSATVVLGYLMTRRGMSYDQSIAHLRLARPWVRPNPGFEAQLRELERLGDLSRWRAWRHTCPPEWLRQLGQAIALGTGAAYVDAHLRAGRCVVSIAPPEENGGGGGGGGSSVQQDLLRLSQLNLHRHAGGGAAAATAAAAAPAHGTAGH
ncbi:dual specificity phosphatase-like [Raphidocelis subcapitata]|uniref:Dual specificity phosphatase-like n=1 Tax=Raphidocelis subcapitata TaxID=307507 RepID=A0A2V0P3S6_9CHLO|nr:dual specificity phosphatase-like [Raphidocelis subcapitata]|eukprot:GBF92500.1 dual specificity phosphatase-like [Raphidocelis subcapitata]